MQISPQIKAAILITIVASVIFAASLAVWLFAPKDWKPLAYLLGPSLAAAAVFLDRYFKISEALVRSGEAGRPRQKAASRLRSRAGLVRQRALRFVRSIKAWLRLGQPWSYDFYERYASATHYNMREHERHRPARCGGIIKNALWAHPPRRPRLVDLGLSAPSPERGDGYYLYRVPIPRNVQHVKLSFSIGIRDGADMTPADNVVQFKIYVDGVPVFDERFRGFYWQPDFLYVDVIPGYKCEVKFVTNAMAEDRGNWAVWGEPILEELT